MCLAKAVQLRDGEQTPLCAYVSTFRTEGDRVVLTDVLGEETSIVGRILSVDLVKNLIVIQAA